MDSDAQFTSIWDALSKHSNKTILFFGWAAFRLCNFIEQEANELIKQNIFPGEIIYIRIKNETNFVLGILTLLKVGARPLLLSNDTPNYEIDRICKNLGVERQLEIINSETPILKLKGNLTIITESVNKSGIILHTSGSSGKAKFIERSEFSLLMEAYRYKYSQLVSSKDKVILPLPISHAYALGWLMGNLLVGAYTILLEPTSLNAITLHISQGATIVVLSPNLARLLAHRQFPEKIKLPFPNLRFVMVGAGPVDTQLERLFKNKFGIELARNYGSTETGAVFAGLPPLPSRSVGFALPEIEYQIISNQGQICAPGESGILQIMDYSGNWYDTGDCVFIDELGRLTPIGRKSESVRRGDRWVSPLEIEEVLRESTIIKDVHIRKGKGSSDGNEHIIADVIPMNFETFQKENLLAYAQTHLATYKIPDFINIKHSLNRSSTGKVKAKPIYSLGNPKVISSMARAYKCSELLFSLNELGILNSLDGKTNTEIIAQKHGLCLEELEIVLEIANSIGIVSSVENNDNPTAFDPNPFIDLELELSRSFTTREEINKVLRYGIHNRLFESTNIPRELIKKYNLAMHGPYSKYRFLSGLRLLRPAPKDTILEVTCGPGTYISYILNNIPDTSGVLFQVGKLAGKCSESIFKLIDSGRITITKEPPQKIFDICIVNNAIHGPSPGDNLKWLIERIIPKGCLYIDDIFLPENGVDAEIGIDWLTHGGISFRTISEIRNSFQELGINIKCFDVKGEVLHKLILVQCKI